MLLEATRMYIDTRIDIRFVCCDCCADVTSGLESIQPGGYAVVGAAAFSAAVTGKLYFNGVVCSMVLQCV